MGAILSTRELIRTYASPRWSQNPKLANYGAFAGARNIDWTKVGFTK